MDERNYDWSAFWPGTTGIFSLAGLVMCASFLGFGALLKGTGLDLWPGLLTTLFIWALPGQVVLVTLLQEGAALIAICLAVGVTAIRLLPMVTVVLAKTELTGAPRWPSYFLAHFIAVTLWVLTGDNVMAMPRPRRLPWLTGLGCCLMFVMLFMTAAGYYLAGVVPISIAAALAFMSPCFFFVSLFAAAKAGMDFLAIAGGVFLIPFCMKLTPDYDLVLAGAVGGTLAYLIGRREMSAK